MGRGETGDKGCVTHCAFYDVELIIVSIKDHAGRGNDIVYIVPIVVEDLIFDGGVQFDLPRGNPIGAALPLPAISLRT
jgi:hypothetical protein